jgi:hypothetical protein
MPSHPFLHNILTELLNLQDYTTKLIFYLFEIKTGSCHIFKRIKICNKNNLWGKQEAPTNCGIFQNSHIHIVKKTLPKSNCLILELSVPLLHVGIQP